MKKIGMIVILIVSMLLLTSCGDTMSELKRGQIATNIKDACETIGGKYSEDTRCCYFENYSGVVGECDEKTMQEKAFIYLNF